MNIFKNDHVDTDININIFKNDHINIFKNDHIDIDTFVDIDIFTKSVDSCGWPACPHFSFRLLISPGKGPQNLFGLLLNF